MIRKYYEVSCDECSCAIGHYTYRPKESAKQHGAILKGSKIFCDRTCEINYNEKLKQVVKK